MKKVFLFLSLCLFVVSFANDAAAQQKKTTYRHCRYTNREQCIYAKQATAGRETAYLAGLSEPGFRYGTSRDMASLPDGQGRWQRSRYT